MTLKNDEKFEKIRFKIDIRNACALKNDMKNLANFHSLKNSDFILESKTTELY